MYDLEFNKIMKSKFWIFEYEELAGYLGILGMKSIAERLSKFIFYKIWLILLNLPIIIKELVVVK